ncbi:flavodoxin family protein [Phytoactinopolyspora limicola]|uniref:flavodoxin family protein n=1 Tax=Phytoactinopolyspora limicola TaxID=2715536 RepID=UPI0014072D71|nr:flavodoxin domain-containing protein [Phytoactinopolyspora limicola]
MRALVVYESMFGHTRSIAEAIAAGLASTMVVDIVEVNDAPTDIGPDVHLIVVGGPTHALGMSRPSTRQEAARQAPDGLVSTGTGIREWLATLHPPTTTLAAASFDTKARRPRLPGSAAHATARRLRRLGLTMISRPQSFNVDGVTGPLTAGEEDRAREWGHELGDHVPMSR